MGRPFWPGVPGSALMGGRTVQESLGCPSHFTQRPSSRASRVYAGAVGNPPGPGAPKAGPAHPAQECPPWGSGAQLPGPGPPGGDRGSRPLRRLVLRFVPKHNF